jgi:geranylgeranyl pyrophosphate synthase
MIQEVDKVRTANGGEWEYTLPLPDSMDEAQEIYGELNVLKTFQGGLKVKIQNLAREAFRQGKSREEVEEMIEKYRPGVARQSAKKIALQMIAENAAQLESMPDLKEQVFTNFLGSKFQEVVDLLRSI